MKVREVLKLLGRTDGSPSKPKAGIASSNTKKGRIPVSGKGSDDLPPGTLNSILKQAGLTKVKPQKDAAKKENGK